MSPAERIDLNKGRFLDYCILPIVAYCLNHQSLAAPPSVQHGRTVQIAPTNLPRISQGRAMLVWLSRLTFDFATEVRDPISLASR